MVCILTSLGVFLLLTFPLEHVQMGPDAHDQKDQGYQSKNNDDVPKQVHGRWALIYPARHEVKDNTAMAKMIVVRLFMGIWFRRVISKHQTLRANRKH